MQTPRIEFGEENIGHMSSRKSWDKQVRSFQLGKGNEPWALLGEFFGALWADQ